MLYLNYTYIPDSNLPPEPAQQVDVNCNRGESLIALPRRFDTFNIIFN